MQLVTEVFDTRNDPDQISVTAEERDRLFAIHPTTLSELTNDDGPIVWILLIPTTDELMHQFLNGTISEKKLLEETQPGDNYTAIYLCSASVLPEFQHKGLGKKVTLEAIGKIRKDHAIKSLFYWPFSDEGKILAASVAKATGLKLFEKKK